MLLKKKRAMGLAILDQKQVRLDMILFACRMTTFACADEPASARIVQENFRLSNSPEIPAQNSVECGDALHVMPRCRSGGKEKTLQGIEIQGEPKRSESQSLRSKECSLHKAVNAGYARPSLITTRKTRISITAIKQGLCEEFCAENATMASAFSRTAQKSLNRQRAIFGGL